MREAAPNVDSLAEAAERDFLAHDLAAGEARVRAFLSSDPDSSAVRLRGSRLLEQLRVRARTLLDAAAARGRNAALDDPSTSVEALEEIRAWTVPPALADEQRERIRSVESAIARSHAARELAQRIATDASPAPLASRAAEPAAAPAATDHSPEAELVRVRSGRAKLAAALVGLRVEVAKGVEGRGDAFDDGALVLVVRLDLGAIVKLPLAKLRGPLLGALATATDRADVASYLLVRGQGTLALGLAEKSADDELVERARRLAARETASREVGTKE